MERLTKRKYGEIVSAKKERSQTECSCFCNNCSQGTGNCDYVKEMVEKLAAYEDAEGKGLLLRLPCPIGTTVYCIEDECEDIYIEGSDYRFVGEEIFDTWMLNQFGKTVFLTKEEAEQALKDLMK